MPPPGRSNTDGITHPGMSQMKIFARSFVRWPGIDQDIEDTVKTCIPCQWLNTYSTITSTSSNLGIASSPLGSSTPRLCRTAIRHIFLNLVDAYSKWMEVKVVKTATSTTTNEHLRKIISTHRLSEMLVVDNAYSFTSHILY